MAWHDVANAAFNSKKKKEKKEREVSLYRRIVLKFKE
jgi:hypothetical protein